MQVTNHFPNRLLLDNSSLVKPSAIQKFDLPISKLPFFKGSDGAEELQSRNIEVFQAADDSRGLAVGAILGVVVAFFLYIVPLCIDCFSFDSDSADEELNLEKDSNVVEEAIDRIMDAMLEEQYADRFGFLKGKTPKERQIDFKEKIEAIDPVYMEFLCRWMLSEQLVSENSATCPHFFLASDVYGENLKPHFNSLLRQFRGEKDIDVKVLGNTVPIKLPDEEKPYVLKQLFAQLENTPEKKDDGKAIDPQLSLAGKQMLNEITAFITRHVTRNNSLFCKIIPQAQQEWLNNHESNYTQRAI